MAVDAALCRLRGGVIVVHECSDIEQRWAEALCAEAEAEYELEQDAAIALALDPYEEIPVAMEDAFWCEMYYRQQP